MSNETQLACLSVRIDPELRDRLAREAAEARRPLSQHFRNLFEDLLRERDRRDEYAGGRRHG